MPSTDDLDALIRAAGLEDERAAIAPYAGVQLALVRDGGIGRAGGATRLGGAPEVPAGFVWPSHAWPRAEVEAWPDFAQEQLAQARALGQVIDDGGWVRMPIPFLAQIDLGVLGVADRRGLPASGLLLLFAAVTTDVADPRYAKRVAAAVVHVDGALAPCAVPPLADPAPNSALPMRLERRLACDLPWEVWSEVSARLAPGPRDALEAACQIGDALWPIGRDEGAGPMPPVGQVALARLVEHDEVGLFIGDASWVTFAIPADALARGDLGAACASVFIG